MSGWKGIVGQCFNPASFAAYVQTLSWDVWIPSFIVLHNTGVPTLAQRPNGLGMNHILGLEDFYKNEQHWSAGPHCFCDDQHGIWVFTPLTTPGVHSPSWNAVSLGIEMLGDFDVEDFNSGRGLAVQQNAIAAVAILSAAIGLDPGTMMLHREDPGTDHHCPGDSVDKTAFIQAVRGYAV